MSTLIFDLKPASDHNLNLLINTFQQLNMRPVRLPSLDVPYFYFSGVLALSKVKQYLHVYFKVNIIRDKLIKLQLNLNPQLSSFSRWLMEFLQPRFAQVCHFVHITNHLQLNEREGVFSCYELTGNVAYQTSISCIFMLTSKLKQETVLTSHIRKMVRIYSEALENIIFYYRIPGFNLHQLQLMLQDQNGVPLKSVAEKIVLLKNLFDQVAQPNRKQQHDQQKIQETLSFVRGANPLETMISSSIKKEHLQKAQVQFACEQKMLIKHLEQFQKLKFDSILTSIEIIQKSMELPITKGGFSYITYGLYDFVPLFSVHDQVNQELAERQNLQSQKGSVNPASRTGCCLVKKASLNRQRMTEQLRNECSFLTYMKSKICPYFAKYYCNKSIIPFSDGYIYLQYYPTSLDQTRLRQEGKLKVLQDVSMGLLFLSKEEILHRDLKELNIMVDRSKRARVIDFGSVAPFYRSQKFKINDTRLRSTPGYFYSYHRLCDTHPKLTMLYSKEEYYRHPNFDVYSLGRIIRNQFSLEMITSEGDFLRHFLQYLSVRCMEVDPGKRWSVVQILYFLRQLLGYLQQQSRFWKYGFDKGCKAHRIGTGIAYKEFTNEQRALEQINSGKK